MDHISPEEALQKEFTAVEPGFTWGKTWEYCWFKGTVVLPKGAEGKRIVMDWMPAGSRPCLSMGNHLVIIVRLG